MERHAARRRTTRETDVSVELCLDGRGSASVGTGVPFLDHMLDALARHGLFDLEVRASGDTAVDDHHTVEDVGICLGDAFAQALGELRGVNRYASTILPMDEALILTAVDLSGRALQCYDLNIPTQKVGAFDTELTEEFFMAFVRRAGLTLHVRQLAGRNSHHIIEGAFKSLGRSLRQAVAIDPEFAQEIPSTKEVLK